MPPSQAVAIGVLSVSRLQRWPVDHSSAAIPRVRASGPRRAKLIQRGASRVKSPRPPVDTSAASGPGATSTQSGTRARTPRACMTRPPPPSVSMPPTGYGSSDRARAFPLSPSLFRNRSVIRQIRTAGWRLRVRVPLVPSDPLAKLPVMANVCLVAPVRLVVSAEDAALLRPRWSGRTLRGRGSRSADTPSVGPAAPVRPDRGEVSIWTLAGRRRVQFVCASASGRCSSRRRGFGSGARRRPQAVQKPSLAGMKTSGWL